MKNKALCRYDMDVLWCIAPPIRHLLIYRTFSYSSDAADDGLWFLWATAHNSVADHDRKLFAGPLGEASKNSSDMGTFSPGASFRTISSHFQKTAYDHVFRERLSSSTYFRLSMAFSLRLPSSKCFQFPLFLRSVLSYHSNFGIFVSVSTFFSHRPYVLVTEQAIPFGCSTCYCPFVAGHVSC